MIELSVLRKATSYLRSGLRKFEIVNGVQRMVNQIDNLTRHERICVVSDFQGNSPVGTMARRVARAMGVPHVFADTEATIWIYNPLRASESKFTDAMELILENISCSRVTHLHLELGMYGKSLDQMRNNILGIINASEDLVIFVHSLHVNDETFRPLYEEILGVCNKKSETACVNVWVNNEKDEINVKLLFSGRVINSPVLYFSRKLRKELVRRGGEIKNSRSDQCVYVGVFGYINGHKDYETTLRAFSLLPENYKLVIAGGAHPGERAINQKNLSITALDNLIWSFRNTNLIDRIVFKDGLNDLEFFSLMASLDVVLINYIETAMSASSVLSQALELGVPVVASRCTTFESACAHFGNSWLFFDPGNSLQLKQKIMEFQSHKLITRIPALEDICGELAV